MISKCSNPHVKRFHPENIQEASVQWNFLYLCSNHKSCSYLWPIWVLFMVVHGRSPPVRIGIGGTLTNTNSSIPRASPWPKLCELSYERCIGPIDLDSPTFSCPVVTVPNAGINSQSLLIGISYPLVLVVLENTNWSTINVPPESVFSNKLRVWEIYI